MRALGFFFTLFLVVGVASAQAPSNKPSGTLAQLMRGILFPNSNLIFDVQAKDPEAPPEAGGDGTVTSTFASIYAGWPSVENAALALAESANLIVLQGRMCENGRPVPLDQDDFVQWAQNLEEVGREAYRVAQTKDRDAMIETTNLVAGACENCHLKYRRYPESSRCQ